MTNLRYARWSCGLVLALAACDGPRASAACGGAAPLVAECERGVFFADCGGTSEPRFGCSDSLCLWFVGGCVASDFVASDCPATDPCCHDIEAGTWAFADWEPARLFASRVVEDVAVLGGTPMTRATGTPLTIDAALEVQTPHVQCALGTDLQICNGISVFEFHWLALGPAVWTELRNDAEAAEVVRIELVPQPDGTIVARSLAEHFDDTTLDPPVSCEASRSADVEVRVVSGVLTTADLSDPRGLHGYLLLAAGAGEVDVFF